MLWCLVSINSNRVGKINNWRCDEQHKTEKSQMVDLTAARWQTSDMPKLNQKKVSK